MKTTTRFSAFTVALLGSFLCVGSFILSGCTDAVTRYDEAESAHLTHGGDKFRHRHLLGQATTRTTTAAGKKPGSGGGNGGGSTTTTDTGLIFAISPQSTVEPHRVLDRYKVVERFRVFDRFEYTYVYDGYAIWADSANAPDLIADMEADPDIAWVEPDIYVGHWPLAWNTEPDGGLELLPWGTVRIGGQGYLAPGVEFFMIDTGVSQNDINTVEHVDLRENGTDPEDYDGHGTHLAALAGAIDDGDGLIGVAPGVNLHSLKVLNGDEQNHDGEVELAATIAAVEHVVGQKLINPNTPMVVNFSLGADIGTTAYNALDQAIAAAVANGVTFVISAGNHGIDAETVTPAHVAEAITVGAYDMNDQFTAFSNFGAGVDILAPGVDLLSLPSDHGSNVGFYVQMSGTSQAAALVSGAAALYLAENPNASPQQVREALVGSGQAVIGGVPGGTTNTSVYVPSLMGMEVPPFFQYAVTTAGNITLNTGGVVIGIESGGNPLRNTNVFANNNISVGRSGNLVHGFAYYGNDILGQNRKINGTFVPNYNPSGAAVHQQQAPIPISAFDPQAHQSLATQTSSGLTLSGHYTLGTRDNPVIWYVDGQLNTGGPVTLSGYGVFVVNGNVSFGHDVTTQNAGEETALGFYTNGNITFGADGLNIAALLFTNNNVTVNQGTTLYGNITTNGNVTFNHPATIYYRPASPALTEPFWPMGAGQ